MQLGPVYYDIVYLLAHKRLLLMSVYMSRPDLMVIYSCREGAGVICFSSLPRDVVWTTTLYPASRL